MCSLSDTCVESAGSCFKSVGIRDFCSTKKGHNKADMESTKEKKKGSQSRKQGPLKKVMVKKRFKSSQTRV